MKINSLFPDVVEENLSYEFKVTLNENNPIKWAKTIVAYANSEGGTIFVGVSDEGEAFGIDLPEIDKLKKLVALVNDRHIKAKISFLLRNVDDSMQAFVLAIKVAKSESLVRYKSGDYNEQVFIRQDGSSTPANPEEIIALAKRKQGIDNETTDIPYNEQNWSHYLALCRNYRSDNSIPKLKELQSMEIVSSKGFAKSGFLMFEDSFSGDDSLICCRLWQGKSKLGTVLDKDRFKGPLSEVFSQTLSFIERNTKKGWRKTPQGGREEIRSYPQIAIREGVINAIAHRDYAIYGTQIDVDIYSDRIEIISPGSWFLPVPDEAYEYNSIPSIRRNTIIAATLDVANLTERSGTGIQAIMDSYKNAPQSKQPCLMIFPGFINLRMFDMLAQEESEVDVHILTDKEKVLRLLQEGPKHARQLQAATPYKNRTRFLRDVMNPLLEQGIVVREGNPKSPLSTFRLIPQKNE